MSKSLETKEKVAVVLFNMGGPDSLKAIKPYLFNLFYDPAIIALKNPLRWLVAKTISRKRMPITKEIYQKIGGKSPILEHTKAQAKALEAKLNEENDAEYACFIAMRYWHPLSQETVKQVSKFKPDRIILLPLYPHYSITTAGSSLINWDKYARKAGLDIPYRAIRDHAQEEGYIEAHVSLIEQAREKLTDPENFRILYSAHGLPEKIIEAGDPYRDQIERNCQVLQERLGHPDYVVCFQSRSGPLKWIEPYTKDEIRRAGEQKKSIIIVPIAFVSEHSETLVELDMEYRILAQQCGVKDYIRVAAIGCHDSYICALAKLAKDAFK